MIFVEHECPKSPRTSQQRPRTSESTLKEALEPPKEAPRRPKKATRDIDNRIGAGWWGYCWELNVGAAGPHQSILAS